MGKIKNLISNFVSFFSKTSKLDHLLVAFHHNSFAFRKPPFDRANNYRKLYGQQCHFCQPRARFLSLGRHLFEQPHAVSSKRFRRFIYQQQNIGYFPDFLFAQIGRAHV